ncbi:IS66 family insertion sequence element accessory protein TnpB [Cesiribacter sp. SM1]|uniref:IS66 family insertion sequence element accessory protein TnpA n=1 Tax=Cesiribacter sp. SM1 TaxID=2861196 RepID=UPI001CD2B971|nr:IS66 family insertion sequence element accessory protein TnpB [Cesiribacter sp. SM1]
MNIGEKMFKLVEDCLRSGKTQKQYSQEVGIGYARFNYWVCRYRKQQQPMTSAGFIKVDTLPVSEDLEICYPNGVRLKAQGADLSLISQLIRLY